VGAEERYMIENDLHDVDIVGLTLRSQREVDIEH
jgi:hypothetical protein